MIATAMATLIATDRALETSRLVSLIQRPQASDKLSLGSLRSPISRPKHSPCQIVPPCKQGRHGYHFSPVASEQRSANVLGKYHLTEEGLKHDLGALRRGEVYGRMDFLRRAKAWYKAEIDRLSHLERVQYVSVLPV